LNLTLRAFEARSAAEIDKAFAGMTHDHPQALVILADAIKGARPYGSADAPRARRRGDRMKKHAQLLGLIFAVGLGSVRFGTADLHHVVTAHIVRGHKQRLPVDIVD
jgi:hypothetical protein